jgi:hypothetical protein
MWRQGQIESLKIRRRSRSELLTFADDKLASESYGYDWAIFF